MIVLTVSELSYANPNCDFLFVNVDFSLSNGEKATLIGNNGTGKSTLLQIIAEKLKPLQGNVFYSQKPYLIPQHFGQYDELTIAQALGIFEKTEALKAILAGDVSEQNYTILNDDWNIEERAVQALEYWGLGNMALSRKMSMLSGGEKTKVFLSGIIIHEPLLVLMDEPTNHLDIESRNRLYNFIETHSSSMLIVSHDRTLLNMIDLTYELSPKGIMKYGGNYEFCKAMKEGKTNALQNRTNEKNKALRIAKKNAADALERREKQGSSDKGRKQKAGTPTALMDKLKGKAEESTSRLKGIHAGKIEKIASELQHIKEETAASKEIKVKFDNSSLHKGKTLFSCDNITFEYTGKMLWHEPLSFKIMSGERIVVRGSNGSGKTTLLKLILGNMKPKSGEIKRADFKHVYIDQDYSLIDNSLTVVEQATSYNVKNLPCSFLKTELHRFLFPADTWDKKCGLLSGGEKMRLIFCCLLISESAPDLFVLDEPTNNLDIQSLGIITSSLQRYRGTVLVISHDRYFIEEIGIEREIDIEAR